MNYLAHLFLAGNNSEIILGNFIADHVKGSNILLYNDLVRKGIAMHRDIDRFTDNHPVVKQSIERLRPHFHKYSGVVVDMFYDHFLSANWSEYSTIDLESFTKKEYDLLNLYKELLPERSARLLFYMEKQNWLLSYASNEGLHMAFMGMSSRTKFKSNMENAVEQLNNCYACFEKEFRLFFPELQAFVSDNYSAEVA